MSTIFTHTAVAIGFSSWLERSPALKQTLIIGMLLSVVPDLDVIGFWFGIPYEHLLGHRGLSHSLLTAFILSGLSAWWVHQQYELNLYALWLYLGVCMMSHGFLDALTNGGLGIAFLSPFSNERFFFPFQPIEVATLNPIRFFQGQGLNVIATELLWVWLPCAFIFLLGLVWKTLTKK
ncbi:MAG: metal-dependent hydrolase [Mariprofundaceae bacterium]|nr:metal-dependent hydrolase [Mariprofundaceae bacterium]